MDFNSIVGIGITTGGDAYLVDLSVGITEINEGEILAVDFSTASTGAATLDPNGIGAIDILNKDGSAISADELFGPNLIQFKAGDLYMMSGKNPLATTTEVSAGIEAGKTITPDALNLSSPTLFALGIVYTAIETDTHALEMIVDAAAFGDTNAVHIDYITGALSASEESSVFLVNIDETLATGGEVVVIKVLSTTQGANEVVAVETGIGVDAIHQEAGTFGNMDSALNKAVDVLAALSSGGAGNISVFVADNDTMTIGDAAEFGEMVVIVDTGASGSGVAPLFEYSTGIGTWSTFVPTDGTAGFRNTGIIAWDVDDLAGFATGTGSEFLIRITRTRNTLSVTPIIDQVQIASFIEYLWNKDGDLTVRNIFAENLYSLIFSDYIIGTTSAPTTTATTSGTAVVIAEMTKTFTPASDTNKIEVQVVCSFSNTGDQTAIMGIFIDGVLQAETETHEYANAGVFTGSISIFWHGTHATSSMAITARMWTTGGTLTAIGVLRNMSVKETNE